MQSIDFTLLEVCGLSKLYARTPAISRMRAAGIFKKIITGGIDTTIGPLRPTEFWALKDISFQVQKGDALGIIGLNGSGKTTLLRILAGQLLPDEGEVRRNGSTAALIDATAGFRTNATGKENIFLKGAMLGRSRVEMEAAYDEIVAFTELGDAIHAPLSSYSAGMLMRLAFAINTATNPDILLIDETLSVGDFRFRQKCLARLRELRERCGFVLVSHSMNDVRRFCTRVLVIHKGKIAYEGNPDDAVTFYEGIDLEEKNLTNKKAAILGPWLHNDSVVESIENYWCDAYGNAVTKIMPGETLYFHVALKLSYSPRQLIMGIPVWNEEGQYITGFSTEISGDIFKVEAGTRTVFCVEIPHLAFNPGTYLSNLGVVDGAEFLARIENPVLTVEKTPRPFWGAVTLPHTWRAHK